MLIDNNKAQEFFSGLRASGKTIVATNGCFDILHVGHLRYLAESRRHGDLLVVGLNSDASVRRLKGSTRPINSEHDRAELLMALRVVDYVVIFAEDDASEFLKLVQPQIYTKGGDYDLASLPEASTARAIGTKIILVPLVEGKSSTNTIKKIQS